jgi:hypothetical protein
LLSQGQISGSAGGTEQTCIGIHHSVDAELLDEWPEASLAAHRFKECGGLKAMNLFGSRAPTNPQAPRA